jgi:hypothetical protein
MARHIMCLWVPIACIVTLIYLFDHPYDMRNEYFPVTVLLMFMWGIALLIVSVTCVNLISAERANQCLSVLATTPMKGRQIILEKVKGMRRFLFILMGPFVIVFFFEGWCEAKYGDPEIDLFSYLFFSLCSILIYFPMVAWLAVLCGLKYEKRARAMVMSLVYLILWMGGPYLITFLIILTNPSGLDENIAYLLLASPLMMPIMSEFSEVFESVDGFIWVPGLINYLWYYWMMRVLRAACLDGADRFIGRAVPSDNTLPKPSAPDMVPPTAG